MVKYHGVSDDAVRLRLFPFTLRDRAKSWLHSLLPGSIATWEEMESKFLNKFFPPAKTAKLRNDINTFYQHEGESLYEAWERFKELLRRCPHHGMPIWSQVQTFYNGINAQTRNNVDAAAGGALLNKTQEQAYELLEEMAANNSQWTNERNQHPRRAMAVNENDKIANLTAQIANLTKQLGSMSSNNSNTNSVASASFACCENCGDNHDSASCQVGNPFAQSHETNDVNYVGNFQRQANNPYSNTYNPGWRNHPNFSWRDNANQGNQPRGQIHICKARHNNSRIIIFIIKLLFNHPTSTPT